MSDCKAIAVCNQKGGVGKTTTVLNLGVALAREGKRVLLIDADPQANLTMALGVDYQEQLPETTGSIMERVLLQEPIPPDGGVLHHEEGIDLLPASPDLAAISARLVSEPNRERVLRTYLKAVRPQYDYILIDCMPSLEAITLNAVSAADQVLIPTQSQYFSGRALEQVIHTVRLVRQHINPKLTIGGILVTMTRHTNMDREMIAQIRGSYGSRIPVFRTEIPLSVRVAEASAAGCSLFAYRPNDRVTLAHGQLAKEVIDLAVKTRTQVRAEKSVR